MFKQITIIFLSFAVFANPALSAFAQDTGSQVSEVRASSPLPPTTLPPTTPTTPAQSERPTFSIVPNIGDPGILVPPGNTPNVDPNNNPDNNSLTPANDRPKKPKGDVGDEVTKTPDERETKDNEDGEESVTGNEVVENPITIKNLLPDIDTLTGSLTYKYEFALPPGRNGLTPELHLTYNSGTAANSNIAGYGWSLSIPYIERINRRGMDELYTADKFSSSLSGELVLTSGTTTYMSRVEGGPFMSYERSGNAWTVTDKSGTRYIFGAATTSSLQNDPTDANKIYKWMVEEIRDTNDNFIKFEYTKDGNHVYPSSVNYTGSGQTDGIFDVDFIYENRDDAHVSYNMGFRATTSKRMAEMEIKVGGSPTKDYAFDYIAGDNGNRSLLQSITVTSGGVSLPPTVFTYQTDPTNLGFRPESYQLPSFISEEPTAHHVFTALGSSAASSTLLEDVNGDGLSDFISMIEYTDDDGVIPDNIGSRPRVYLNTGSAWEFNPNLYQLPSFILNTGQRRFFPLEQRAKFADVNGDGLPDFVVTLAVTDSDGIIEDLNGDLPRVYLNTGSGWEFNPDFYQIPSFYSGGLFYFLSLGESANQLTDVNGDGLLDWVYSFNGSDDDGYIPDNNGDYSRVYLNTGTGWEFNPDIYQLPSLVIGSEHFYMGLNVATRIVDIDGDGLPDFVHSHTNYQNTTGYVSNNIGSAPRVYMNTGAGWQFNPDFYQLPSFYEPSDEKYHFIGLTNSAQLIDVNSDSLPDIAFTINHNDTDGFIPDNIGHAPRVYMNTGKGWKFDSNIYQLPSFWSASTSDYAYMHLSKNVQFSDVNNDNLPEFVYTTYNQSNATGHIPDNDNIWPRAYKNTGSGWTFDPDFYQVPSFYSTSSSNYNFLSLEGASQFTDFNGDGASDFIYSSGFIDQDGYIPDNNGYAPRVYANLGKTSDYLSSIHLPAGGTTTFNYKPSVVLGKNPSPSHQSLYTIQNIVTNDGMGNLATTTYSYADGEYFYHSTTSDQFRQFSGFGRVDKTDPVGNVTKTYFHQGNQTATSTGEYNDHISKAGRPYRIEKYDGSGNLYSKNINKWDHAALNATSTFVKLADSLEMTYDGNATHKDKAESNLYDNSNGNLSQKISFGDVSGNDNGTFSDSESDKLTTSITYATSSSGKIIVPSREITVDQSGATLRDSKNYYDTLSLGSVDKGNLTKQESRKSGTSSPIYIDVEKTYNSYGLVTQEKDPRDKVTTYTYDSFNLYPATTTNALGQCTAFQYDYSLGRPKQTKDPNGYIFEASFDGFGRILEEKQPDIASPSTLVTKTLYQYTDTGLPRSARITDHLNSGTSTETYKYFDGLGQMIQERKESEDSYSVRDHIYGKIGKVSKNSLPYFSSGASSTPPTASSSLYINYSYDPLGRITTIANAVGTTTNVYDDRKLTVTDALGKVKHLYKDAYDNLIKVEEINGGNTYTTNYEYNGNKNLTKITDALGNIRNFTYDGLGRLVTSEDLHASGDSYFGTWTFSYDDSGNLISKTDPIAHTIEYTYDDINRLLTEDLTTGFGEVTQNYDVMYAYDTCAGGIGKLCIATTTAVISSYEYNPLGLVKKETKKIGKPSYATEYDYDRQGNILTITNPDSSRIKYEYNPAGLLEKIQWKEAATPYADVARDLDYSPLGQISYMEYGNGASTTNTYDSTKLYRLSNKTTRHNATKLQDLSYTYDAVGNITQIIDASNTNSAKTTAYTYDDLHRLTSASTTLAAYGGNYLETYAYNAVGNITNKSDQGNYSYTGDQGGSYANPHAVTSINGGSVTYDNNGNLLTYGSLSNTWDYNNRLVGTTAGSSTITYGYDHAGERVKYAIATSTTLYITRGYELTGATSSKHIYAGEDLVGNVSGSGASAVLRQIHSDHLTGSNAISNSGGALEELTEYFPYGKIRLDQQSSSFKESRKFTGHTQDQESDLTYAKARYYDGKTARFQSVDPMYLDVGKDLSKYSKTLEQLLSNPQELNSYSYVLNNPLKYKDPTGESMQDRINGVAYAGWNALQNTVLFPISLLTQPRQTISNISNLPHSFPNEINRIGTLINSGDDFKNAYGLTEAGIMLLFAGRNAKVASGLKLGDEVPSLGKIIENAPGTIRGFNHNGTYHGLDQIISRGVSPQDLFGTVKNPLVRFEGRFGRTGYLSNNAYVVLDKSNQVVTSWSKNEFGNNIYSILQIVNAH